MAERNKYTPPEGTAADAAHTVTRAGLGTIPVVGGAASELFSAVVTSSLDRRRQEWMEQVGEGLRALEQKRGINIEDLGDNESFIDTVMLASQAAIRNSQHEKRRALLNAVLNAALPDAPDQARQHMFVDLVDVFTEWHLRILALFHDPPGWFERHGAPANLGMGGLSRVLIEAFPELRDQRPLYDQIWRDLYTRGLVNTEILHVTMSGQGLAQRRTTDLGAEFLAFLMDPISDGTD